MAEKVISKELIEDMKEKIVDLSKLIVATGDDFSIHISNEGTKRWIAVEIEPDLYWQIVSLCKPDVRVKEHVINGSYSYFAYSGDVIFFARGTEQDKRVEEFRDAE